MTPLTISTTAHNSYCSHQTQIERPNKLGTVNLAEAQWQKEGAISPLTLHSFKYALAGSAQRDRIHLHTRTDTKLGDADEDECSFSLEVLPARWPGTFPTGVALCD